MNTKDLLLLIGLGILFICPVIGCFGHQEGYSGDNIDDKLEQECKILKEKKKAAAETTPTERRRHTLDKKLYEAKFIRNKGDLPPHERSVIEAEIRVIEKDINANNLDDACDRVIKFCKNSKADRKEFRWKLDNDVANYRSVTDR